MDKLIGFIWRRADFDLAAFSNHWRTTHRDHALMLDRWLRGYVQSHLLPGPWTDVRRPADGCPTLWVDDRAAMIDLAQSEAFRTGAGPDEARFMEGRSASLAVTEEVLVPPPPNAAVKLMLFLGVRQGGDAGAGWPAEHACGRVRNRGLPDGATDMAAGFDIVDEFWWADEAAYQADLDRAGSPTALDWVDPSRVRAAFVDELIVIPPPR